MNAKSFRSLLGLLQNLESFCDQVSQDTTRDDLAESAELQRVTVQELQKVLAGFFVSEGRDDALTRPPLAEIVRKPLGPADTFENRPIFIIGNRRSGTTLLAYLLNASSNICALPENFLAGTVASADALITVGHRMMTSMSEPFPRYLVRLGQFVDSFYSAYATNLSKSRWVSKELFVPGRLDLLDAMFDYRAQFVFIVRHGLDVAYSCSSRFPGRDGPPLNRNTSLDVETYLNEWIENTEATMDFYERNSGRCFFMRYEDLGVSPKGVGKRLFDFLDEQWDDGLLSRMQDQELSGMGDNTILSRGSSIATSRQVWKSWPSSLLKSLARRADPILHRVGYDPIEVAIQS